MIMKVVTIHTKVSIRATCCSPGWTMILYTHRRCLEVARNGPAAGVPACLLLRYESYEPGRRPRSESEPELRLGSQVVIGPLLRTFSSIENSYKRWDQRFRLPRPSSNIV